MPLTPAEVANKQFKIAFRGYSLDEVDAFLDEVESELSRLLRDNAEGRSQPAVAGPTPPTVTPAPVSSPEQLPLDSLRGQEAALRTLLLAQRTADEAIAEARAEAEQILATARSEAESAMGSARSEASSTLARARSEAQSTLSASQHKAASVDADVAARIQAATGNLDERRRELESRIEDLRAFEREYRTRLQAYLESQLRDLGSRQGPDDPGAGVPAGAGAAAVGLTPGSAAGIRGRGPAGSAGVAPTPAPAQAPAGPPREAAAAPAPAVAPAVTPAAGRAVPPLAAGGPDPVGPFTVVPTAAPTREGDAPVTDR